MWQRKDNALYKEFVFKDFKQAFKFMNDVAGAAEEQQHHPKWLNEWNKVEIWLVTHSEGNKVTEKDHSMSRKIDNIYRKYL